MSFVLRRQNYDHDAIETPVTSNSTTHKRKRSRSNSLPIIDSVSSEPQLTTTNIVVHLDNRPHCSLQSDSCTMLPNSSEIINAV
jgi:hypothetical protein